MQKRRHLVIIERSIDSSDSMLTILTTNIVHDEFVSYMIGLPPSVLRISLQFHISPLHNLYLYLFRGNNPSDRVSEHEDECYFSWLFCTEFECLDLTIFREQDDNVVRPIQYI